MEFTEIEGLRVRHLREGAGPPVVVLHGWGANVETVASIVAALSGSREVHALDLPGFGESGEPPAAWGVDEYRDFLAAFMDRMGIARADLVAHSNGGRVALALAAAEPGRVGRLVLVDSAGIRARRGATYYRRVAMAKVGKHAARFLGPPGRALQRRLFARAASADYAAATPAMRETFKRLVGSDLRDLMGRVQVPTLLIWGSADTATPLADAHAMERLIPDAGLVVFEGAGHFSYLDEPGRFAIVVRHFLGVEAGAVAAAEPGGADAGGGARGADAEAGEVRAAGSGGADAGGEQAGDAEAGGVRTAGSGADVRAARGGGGAEASDAPGADAGRERAGDGEAEGS